MGYTVCPSSPQKDTLLVEETSPLAPYKANGSLGKHVLNHYSTVASIIAHELWDTRPHTYSMYILEVL